MSEKANPAVKAPHGAVLQVGTVPQDRIEGELILTNKRISTFVLVPISRKREYLLESYDIKAKFSVMMWILSFMTSSYLLDAKASTGRARFFRAIE